MNNQHLLTKVSFGIVIAAVLVLLVYFVAVMPQEPVTNWGGMLVLTPPLFGIFGFITAMLGRRKSKGSLSTALIIVNILFLFWWPIFWVGGTLLFGP